MAIDEQRGPFRPTLWTQQADAPTEQTVEQVWLTGVHCDVGGGYLVHELSDIPLLWMVERANRFGLRFDPDAFIRRPARGASTSLDDGTLRSRTYVKPDLRGDRHDSRKGFYRLARLTSDR